MVSIRKLSTVLFGLALFLPGLLVAQESDRLKPFAATGFKFLQKKRTAEYARGVVNELENQGWRVFDIDRFGWNYLLDRNISYIEIGRTEEGKAELIPRVDVVVGRLDGSPQQPTSLFGVGYGRIYLDNIFSLTEEKPLILLKLEDLLPIDPDAKRRLSEYSQRWSVMDAVSGITIVHRWEKYLKARGWKSVYGIGVLPLEDLRDVNLAFVDDGVLSIRPFFSIRIEQLHFDQTTDRLLALTASNGNTYFTSEMIGDSFGRPLMYISRPDLDAIYAAHEEVKVNKILKLAENPIDSGRSIILVTSLKGGLDAGLEAKTGPFSQSVFDRLKQLKSLGFKQIHVLTEDGIPTFYMEQWLEEVKNNIFPAEVAKNPEFIQVFTKDIFAAGQAKDPKLKAEGIADEKSFYARALKQWSGSAGDVQADEIFILEEDEQILEKIKMAAKEDPAIFKGINKLTLIKGGENLFQNARYMLRALNFAQKDLAGHAYWLVMEHLILNQAAHGLQEVEELQLLQSGLVGRIEGEETVSWLESRHRLSEILDSLVEQGFTAEEKNTTVILFSTFIEDLDIQTTQGTSVLLDHLSIALPALSEPQKGGFLHLMEGVYGSEAYLGDRVPAFGPDVARVAREMAELKGDPGAGKLAIEKLSRLAERIERLGRRGG